MDYIVSLNCSIATRDSERIVGCAGQVDIVGEPIHGSTSTEAQSRSVLINALLVRFWRIGVSGVPPGDNSTGDRMESPPCDSLQLLACDIAT
jgi:hypothetical protein